MATRVLGIEVGERVVRVCETNMGPGARRVSACAVLQTPPGAVVDGEIRDPEAVAGAMREKLIKSGIKTRNRKVVFSVSSSRIATREVTIPPVRDSRIKAVVEANASDYFPVDMSKYHITYTLLERRPSGEDAGCRLQVLAAPIPILEGYFKLAELMGFTVLAIDYGGNSQASLLGAVGQEGVTMYVDIGDTRSVTTVLKKDRLLMQRTSPSGVEDYVLSYLDLTGRGEGEYLDALMELASRSFQPETAQSLLKGEAGEALSRLVGNIARVADYYNSMNWEMPVEKVVLTGAGAEMPGLKEAVAEATGLEVSVMSRLEKVQSPAGLAPLLPQFVSCIGCAIRPVDLIPEQLSKKRKKEAQAKRESEIQGAAVLAVCVLGALGLAAASYLGYVSALGEKRSLEEKVSGLSYAETVYNNHLAYKKFRDDLGVLEKAASSPNDNLRQFIEELERKMPSEVSILSMSCTKTSVNMNLTAQTKTAAAKAIQQLRTFDSIGEITVGEMTQSVDGSGETTILFSVECRYLEQPYAVPEQNAVKGAPAKG